MSPDVAQLRGLIGLLAELAMRDLMASESDEAATPTKDAAASGDVDERDDPTPPAAAGQ